MHHRCRAASVSEGRRRSTEDSKPSLERSTTPQTLRLVAHSDARRGLGGKCRKPPTGTCLASCSDRGVTECTEHECNRTSPWLINKSQGTQGHSGLRSLGYQLSWSSAWPLGSAEFSPSNRANWSCQWCILNQLRKRTRGLPNLWTTKSSRSQCHSHFRRTWYRPPNFTISRPRANSFFLN